MQKPEPARKAFPYSQTPQGGYCSLLSCRGSLGKLAESIQYFIAGGAVGGTAVDVHKTLAAFCSKDGYAENISVNIFSAVIFRAAV